MNTARLLYRSASTGTELLALPAPSGIAPIRATASATGLETLLQRPDVWRGRHRGSQCSGYIPTGHPDLDERLPGGGWPLGALTELFPDHPGIGELTLLMPALATLSQGERWIVCVGAPHLPYAPAFAAAGLRLTRLLLVQPPAARERLWAVEQALRSGACAAVLAWPDTADDRALRRLQLAAEEGGALGFLFRPGRAARHASPAALRLALTPGKAELVVQVLKCRGGWSRGPVHLSRKLLKEEEKDLNAESAEEEAKGRKGSKGDEGSASLAAWAES